MVDLHSLEQNLKEALLKLFRSEESDLNFGVYKIMNKDRERVEQFINKDSKLSAVEANEAKITIYNAIIGVFSRYYVDGDFTPPRRHGGKDRYVIPYHREEVLLYWATKDLYYVKSSEYLHNYKFRAGSIKCRFKVVQSEEKAGNLKTNRKKYFILASNVDSLISYENNELTICFEFREISKEEKVKMGLKDAPKQSDVNQKTLEKLQEIPENNTALELLLKKESGSDRSIIEKHLNAFTRRNNIDFFMHKAFGDFLRRELDFYIENELLDLDLFNPTTEKHREKIDEKMLTYELFKTIALKIIDFLDQIENFKKKIWEKMKDAKLELISELISKNDFLANEYEIVLVRSENKQTTLQVPNSLKQLKDLYFSLNKIRTPYKEKEHLEIISNSGPYTKDILEIGILNYDLHFYTPLTAKTSGKGTQNFGPSLEYSVPTPLNSNELKTVMEIRKFTEGNNMPKGKSICLLRTPVKRGIGFFNESGFYPDFILWLVDETKTSKKQHIIFLEPKGFIFIHPNHEKEEFIKKRVKSLNSKIKKNIDVSFSGWDVCVWAFLLSGTKYDELQGTSWHSEYSSKKEMEEDKIYFLGDSDWFKRIIEKVGWR